MNSEIFSDAESRIFGARLTAIDVQSLCDRLDNLVGTKVAEVIMHNLEFRDGKLDAARVRAEESKATLEEVVERLVRIVRLSGVGVSRVTLPESGKGPIAIEIENPSVKGTGGAAKAFAFSWWAGAFTSLLDKEMDVENFVYYPDRDVMRCQIVPRG